MMTLTDMDWGSAEWDVDLQAETLNKSLFGKTKAHNKVKADLNLSEKDVSFLGADSDDDNENLSKKAKKKLKERKRKENKRNKNITASSENDGQKSNVESEEQFNSTEKESKVDKKSRKLQAKTVVKKPNSGDSQVALNSKLKDKKTPAATLVSEETGMKKKRKIPLDKKSSEAIVEVKKSKKDEDVVLDNEDTPKKKRKRRKKKKPNSKRNKYKHLGLKSKSLGDPDSLEGDSDSGEEEEAIEDSKDDSLTPVKFAVKNDVQSSVTKKRKNSLSAEKILPAKKSKMEKLDKVSSSAKVKNRKKECVEKADATEEKKFESSDGDHSKISKKKKIKSGIEDSNLDNGDKSKISNYLMVDNEKNNLKKKKGKKMKNISSSNSEIELAEPPKSSPFFTSTHGSELQQKMVDKLASARFRFINEQLYTIKGGEAFRMFQQDNTLMAAYNTGFQGQVKQWSVNPLDVIIKQLNTKSAKLKVVDFGCGEARLSVSVPQTVHSFDLYALNERVTVCDMAKTSLDSSSMDIVVFCLSLMGTNLNDYIMEANRILKDGGLLKIAEVVSRFTVPNHFINAVTSMGFKAVNTRELSTMFYLMDFKKVKNMEKSSKQMKTISLKPCVYKKR